MKKKVIIIDHREEGFKLEKEIFKDEDVELIISSCENEDELIEVVKDAFVIIFTSSRISEKLITQLTKCKMLVRYGVGLDTVDVKAASEKGIYVCNAPTFGSFAVAEHAFSLLLCVNRKITLLDQNVRNNVWEIGKVLPVTSLRSKTLGIVGFGSIGQYVCKMARAFEMDVIIYDPFVDERTANNHGSVKVDFESLIKNSDHITLHAPLTQETYHLFDEKVFCDMRYTATIINTSRGGLINQSDLIEALKSREIVGAGLDVFENEPIEPGSELLKMNNVVLTPHLAWYTEESILNLHQEVIDNVLRVLRGKVPENVINEIRMD